MKSDIKEKFVSIKVARELYDILTPEFHAELDLTRTFLWFAFSKKRKISIEDGKTPAILHHDIMRKKCCLLTCDPVKQLDHNRPGCSELLKTRVKTKNLKNRS
jgi:hypothetical protein